MLRRDQPELMGEMSRVRENSPREIEHLRPVLRTTRLFRSAVLAISGEKPPLNPMGDENRNSQKSIVDSSDGWLLLESGLLNFQRTFV